MMEALRAAFGVSILLWALVTDLRVHKIRNITVLVGILGGLALHYDRIGAAFLGVLLPLALLPLFAVGIVGAGDVKLLCAVGAVAGYPAIIRIALYSFVFCGLMFLVYLLFQNKAWRMLRDFWKGFIFFASTGRLPASDRSRAIKLPMAGCVFAAFLLVTADNIFAIGRLPLF